MSWWLRASLLLVTFAGLTAILIANGGWLGAGTMAGAIGIAALFFGVFVFAAKQSDKLRDARVAATHPGWGIAGAITTASQSDALRVTERPAQIGVGTTLAYGPGGIELWASDQNGTLVRVLQWPWTEVVDVRAVDGMPFGKDAQMTGLRFTLADGSHQDLHATTTGSLRKATRRTKTPRVAALANDILAHRTAVAGHPTGGTAAGSVDL